ncbi:hypothetical protein ASE92_17975 [Pedobacter sp. Leaf41]|nr:hypothetical protein ASE92_17975 [Pedobacter sp. Leaf41]
MNGIKNGDYVEVLSDLVTKTIPQMRLLQSMKNRFRNDEKLKMSMVGKRTFIFSVNLKEH